MFSNLFLNNGRLRGRLKIAYYAARSILARRGWTVCRGLCNICGSTSQFFGYSVGFDAYSVDPRDETGFCWHCGSQNRNRALAVILQNNFFRTPEVPLRSCKARPNQRIYIAAANGAIYDALRQENDLLYSEYFQDVPTGEYRSGVQCQDLTALTFEDESLDLVVSEHVLEHVNDPVKALAEIARVLKPGGMSIFSIPFEAQQRSVTRMTPDLRELRPRRYHKDPIRNEGALVFTEFSKADFLTRFIGPTGSDAEISVVKDEGCCIEQSLVIMARKRS